MLIHKERSSWQQILSEQQAELQQQQLSPPPTKLLPATCLTTKQTQARRVLQRLDPIDCNISNTMLDILGVSRDEYIELNRTARAAARQAKQTYYTDPFLPFANQRLTKPTY